MEILNIPWAWFYKVLEDLFILRYVTSLHGMYTNHMSHYACMSSIKSGTMRMQRYFFCLFNPEVKIQKLTLHVYTPLTSLGKIFTQTSFTHFIYASLLTFMYVFVCMYISYIFTVFLVDAYHCCIILVTLVKSWHSRILWKSFLQFFLPVLNRNVGPNSYLIQK